jgi:hypothetical protein
MAPKDPGCWLLSVFNISTDLDAIFLIIFVNHETLMTGGRNSQKCSAQPQVQGADMGYQVCPKFGNIFLNQQFPSDHPRRRLRLTTLGSYPEAFIKRFDLLEESFQSLLAKTGCELQSHNLRYLVRDAWQRRNLAQGSQERFEFRVQFLEMLPRPACIRDAVDDFVDKADGGNDVTSAPAEGHIY